MSWNVVVDVALDIGYANRRIYRLKLEKQAGHIRRNAESLDNGAGG